MTSFGEWLRETRQRRGYSLRRLAREVGCSPTYVSVIERGAYVPPAPAMQARLAAALGIDPGEMRRRANEGRIDPELREQMLGHPHQEQLIDLLRVTRGLSETQVEEIVSYIRGHE